MAACTPCAQWWLIVVAIGSHPRGAEAALSLRKQPKLDCVLQLSLLLARPLEPSSLSLTRRVGVMRA